MSDKDRVRIDRGGMEIERSIDIGADTDCETANSECWIREGYSDLRRRSGRFEPV